MALPPILLLEKPRKSKSKSENEVLGSFWDNMDHKVGRSFPLDNFICKKNLVLFLVPQGASGAKIGKI